MWLGTRSLFIGRTMAWVRGICKPITMQCYASFFLGFSSLLIFLAISGLLHNIARNPYPLVLTAEIQPCREVSRIISLWLSILRGAHWALKISYPSGMINGLKLADSACCYQSSIPLPETNVVRLNRSSRMALGQCSSTRTSPTLLSMSFSCCANSLQIWLLMVRARMRVLPPCLLSRSAQATSTGC